MTGLKRWTAAMAVVSGCILASCFTQSVQGDVVDVANAFGTASQSTTGFGLPAINAINGSTAGDVSHTDTGDLMPWWEVDLGAEFDIETINLYNRTSCCGERLYNITVDILDAGVNSVYTSAVLNPWDGVDPIPADPGPGPFTYDLTVEPGGSVTGQTVRVSKVGFAGSEWLSLLEVEAFAEAVIPFNPNVALNKPTTGDVAFGFPTSNGNDGSIDTFTHADNTNPPPDNPFWAVDLEGSFDLTRIELVDRADGCCSPNRLEGSWVTVLDAAMTPIYTSAPITGLTDPSSGELITLDNGGAGFAGAAHIRVDGANQYFQFSELRAIMIPEPATMGLVGIAVIGLIPGFRRQRR